MYLYFKSVELACHMKKVWHKSWPNRRHIFTTNQTHKGKASACLCLSHDYTIFNLGSLHARLKSHYEAWSYKKNRHKKIKAYRKSV